jgi:acetoacetyl-CoA synthetase
MMWNWQISALAVGAEIVLYDGAVSYPDTDALWQLVARERVTMFGTSPAFLQFTQTAGLVPRTRVDLSHLRAMFSTGAVLPDTAFDWVRSDVADVPVQSISGGTDIIGCFVLGHPNLPVYAGESQSKSLAMDVRAQGATAESPIGELVCANPFPSRPLGFYGDPDGKRFHDAYFAQNAGLWTHGDRFEWTTRGSGRIHGRSDGVMNVRGVRIGPAEIYSALAAVEGLRESMAVEYRTTELGFDGRILLLVVLEQGRTLDATLAATLRDAIAARCSAAHVPDAIIQVSDVPQTHNGKRAERAARDAANDRPVANLQALKNPACLDEVRSRLAAGPL